MDGCIVLCTDQRATQDCEKKISSKSDDQTIKVWQRRNSPNWALQVLLYFSEGFPDFFYIFRESHNTLYSDKTEVDVIGWIGSAALPPAKFSADFGP